MTFWVVRAGKHGENESYVLQQGVVAVGWGKTGDISGINDREMLQRLINQTYKEEAVTTTRIWTGELWSLKERIRAGDLVAVPLKTRAAVLIGRISGQYKFAAEAPSEAKHQRPVEWIRTDLPRADIDQDLLYSLGSTLAVFQVRRNNAEERLTALLEGRKQPIVQPSGDIDVSDQEAAPVELGELAADQIVQYIGRKFRGHELARLVAGILDAQGFKVLVSPPGADGGVDIIAGAGAMGFDNPRLVVQVKSSDAPIDVTVLRELTGVMPQFGAQQALVVAWGGFRESVLREARRLFFSVRLWDAGDLVTAIQANFDKLSPELQAELPLKRIWTLVLD